MKPGSKFQHFLQAQEPIYDTVLEELHSGRKMTHWMWFVFPQIAGLGRSPVSERYALDSIGEAREYLSDPVLGRRLLECTGILLRLDESGPERIFGHVDALKLRSSMTLFHLAAPENSDFSGILDKFFHGKPDALTLKIAGSG